MKKDLIYISILVCFAIIFFLREGCHKSSDDKLVSDISNYKTEAQTYKTKLGLVVSTNTALPIATQNQINSLLASNDTMRQWMRQFKEIKGGVVVKETTIVNNVPFPFDKPIPCDFKPFPVKKITKDFQMFTTISNSGFVLDSMKMPNTATIVIGRKKDGFLGLKSKLSVDVNNSNEYIKTSNISGYLYTPEKKWYERTWVHFVSGMVAQYALQKYGSQAVDYVKEKIP